MKHIYTIRLFFLISFFSYFQYGFSQDKTALKMINSESFLNTNMRIKSMLLDQGIKGTATIEFWAKFEDDTQYLSLDLANQDSTSSMADPISFLFNNKNVNLNVKGVVKQSISLAKNDSKKWSHFALGFRATEVQDLYDIVLYVDAQRIEIFRNVKIDKDFGLFFHKTGSDNGVLLTEIRGWDSLRSKIELQSNRYRFNSKETKIQDLISNGLVCCFAGEYNTEAVNDYMPDLTVIQWRNLVKKNGIPSFGRFVSTVNTANTPVILSLMGTSFGDSLKELDQIIVSASQGKDKNFIELSWLHVDGLKSYEVYRDGFYIGEVEVSQSKQSGENMIFVDKDILPSNVYSYRLKGKEPTNTKTIFSNFEEGFILPNGTLSGNIKTQSQVYVKEAAVEIGLSAPNSGIRGNAALFKKGTGRVLFKDRKNLLSSNITLEFWYKNSEANSLGSNSVFKFGEIEIGIASNNGLSSTFLKNGSQTINIPIATTDSSWHHYAYVLADEGVTVFVDKIQKGTMITNFFYKQTSSFEWEMNHVAQSDYLLDEVRIWKGKRTLDMIKGFADYVVRSDTPDLLLHYPMDLKTSTSLYNVASASNEGGVYNGITEQEFLNYESACPILKYIAFTDSNGNYNYNSIYTVGSSDKYTATPTKSNHEFRPVNAGFTIKQSSLTYDYEKTLDFTDISQLPVSGKIYCVENNEKYPVSAGKSIAVDGVPLFGVGTSLESDKFGVYNISAPLGKHKINVSNPELKNNKNLNSLNFTPFLEGEELHSKRYVSSNSKIRGITADKGVTLSGFVKLFNPITAGFADYLVPVQTLVSWGKYSITVTNNKDLEFRYDNVVKETQSIDTSQFSFFALSISANGTYGFMANNEVYKQGTLSRSDADSDYLLLGANVNAKGEVEKQNNFSNVSLIQFRKAYYEEANLKSIKDGKIIAGDEEVLDYSFEFNEETGTRWLSNTKLAKDNYLSIINEEKIKDEEKEKKETVRGGNVKTDNVNIYNYSKSYKYDYLAVNNAYNPKQEGDAYVLNITEPLESIEFEMKTRYHFIGNVVIPCDISIGEWYGTLKRIDAVSPEFTKSITSTHFDKDNKIFLIENLLPGQYQVTITNANNPKIQLDSPIIDLTKESQSFDFEYKETVSLDVGFYKVKDTKLSESFTSLKLEDFEPFSQVECDTDLKGVKLLKEGNSIVVLAKVFETYNGQKCPTEKAQVTFSGDLIQLPSEKTSLNGTTDNKGVYFVKTIVNTANFNSPYTRNLTIYAEKGKWKTSVFTKGFIEGAIKTQNDFSIYTPNVIEVLHDPPGDGSSVKLKKGAKYNTTIKVNGSFSYNYGFSKTTGVAIDNRTLVTVFGVGVSLKAVDFKATNDINYSYKYKGVLEGTGVDEIELTDTYSTAAGGSLSGKKANLFIGSGYLVTIGKGTVLKYDAATCLISKVTDGKIGDVSLKDSFAHTYYDIKKNIIPNLLIAANLEKNTIISSTYIESVKLWLNILTENDYKLNDYVKSDYKFIYDFDFTDPTLKTKATKMYENLPETYDATKYDWSKYKKLSDKFKPLNGNDDNTENRDDINYSNISFDGGGSSITKSIVETSSSSSASTTTYTSNSGIKVSVDSSILNVKNSGSISHFFEMEFSVNRTESQSTSKQFDYILADDDAGDHFALEVKKDLQYDTPIFKTIAGQSSCPAELNTQLRYGVDLAVTEHVLSGKKGDVLMFKIKLKNMQQAKDGIRKSYSLSYRPDTNSKGALIKINGNIANPATFLFPLDPKSPTGVKEELDASIHISVPNGEEAQLVEYKDIRFIYNVPCEDNMDTSYDLNSDIYKAAGLKQSADFYLTAIFQGSCIEGLSMKKPQNNWVINSTSKDIQDFVFTIPGVESGSDGEPIFPGSLTAIDIEYALKDNNTPILIKAVRIEELKKYFNKVDKTFQFPLDVSDLASGEYGFRLTPICGIREEAWRKNTPTAFAYGIISRENPNLLETNPVEGGVLTEGAISATFDKALNPNTLNSQNVSLRGILGGLSKNLISADFKNTNSKITIPQGSFLDLTKDYTIEFWINPASYPVDKPINLLNKGSNYFLSLRSDGSLGYKHGSSDLVEFVTLKPLTLYEWTHVAVVHTNEKSAIYFNGEPVDFISKLFDIDMRTGTEDLLIGGGFLGQLDEIRIWDAVRSKNNIISYKNRQLLGNETNLKAYYTLDNNAVDVDGFKEAVRDYTGNTKGSTANELSWVEGDLAAPLVKEQLVHDIPIVIGTNINKNQIIIKPLNFQTYYLEGAYLTAILSDNKIKATDGNFVIGTSWAFTINKNNVAWSKYNITTSQAVNQSVSINAILKNNGGTKSTYELQDLPEWLKCTTRAVGKNVTLNPGFEENFTFVTSENLNQGIYVANIGVITYNSSGVKTGYEYFTLELTVDCETPLYSFEQSDFSEKKEIIAELRIKGELSDDPNDIVVAYFGDQIRGIGKPTKLNNKMYTFLDFHYNKTDNRTIPLTFVIWDDSDCREYSVNSLIRIDKNNQIGTISYPYNISTNGIERKRIRLEKGYQWVSFNLINSLKNPELGLNSITGFNTGEEIAQQFTEGGIITYDVNKNPTGGISAINFKEGYLVKSSSPKDIFLEGIGASNAEDITINGDNEPNYFGYIPNTILSVKYALRSLGNKLTVGDRISGREGFSEFTSDGWVGTLNYLRPNKSYLIMMKNAGILNYSGIVKTITKTNKFSTLRSTKIEDFANSTVAEDKKYLKKAASEGIVIDEYKYPATMFLAGKINSDFINDNEEHTIVAISDGKFRGVAKPILIDNKWIYFMTIHGEGNEKISFKIINDKNIFDCKESCSFGKDKFVGKVDDPYLFEINKNTNSNKTNNIVLTIDSNPVKEKSTITISPSVTDYYEFDIYNLLGVRVARQYKDKIEAGTTITIPLDRRAGGDFNNLSKGIYICVLRGSNSLNFLKIILD